MINELPRTNWPITSISPIDEGGVNGTSSVLVSDERRQRRPKTCWLGLAGSVYWNFVEMTGV